MATESTDSIKKDNQKTFIINSIEATVRIGLALLVVYLCLDIIRPFFVPILWGLIIAISLYPVHRWLADKLGKSPKISAALIAFGCLGLLIYPSISFSARMVANLKALSGGFKSGEFILPPPPDTVQQWPFVGYHRGRSRYHDGRARLWRGVGSGLGNSQYRCQRFYDRQ